MCLTDVWNVCNIGKECGTDVWNTNKNVKNITVCKDTCLINILYSVTWIYFEATSISISYCAQYDFFFNISDIS